MATEHQDIARALAMIFDGIELLRSSCRGWRQFTIDGRLVGDIGEILAEREYEIELTPKSYGHPGNQRRKSRRLAGEGQ